MPVYHTNPRIVTQLVDDLSPSSLGEDPPDAAAADRFPAVSPGDNGGPKLPMAFNTAVVWSNDWMMVPL